MPGGAPRPSRDSPKPVALADRLVGLHERIAETLPEAHRAKMRVIYQSALPIGRRRPVKRSFRVCVAGHLREEKDPLRPAYAVRDLPGESRIRVEHYGKPHTPDWAEAARAEMAVNRRYRWHGEVSHHRIRRVYASSHLLALPSRMEGGANVISEAVVAGLPVVASRIHGSIGLLGEDYPGYYTTADTGELRELLLRAESDHEFYQRLAAAAAERRALFTPEREFESWRRLLAELG